MSNPAKSIRIGTMVSASKGGADKRIGQIADMGFESFEPFFWQTDQRPGSRRTWQALASMPISGRDITISTLGMFGNPLETTEHRP